MYLYMMYIYCIVVDPVYFFSFKRKTLDKKNLYSRREKRVFFFIISIIIIIIMTFIIISQTLSLKKRQIGSKVYDKKK